MAQRILFLRPDTYGDIVAFEPVLRAAVEAWPDAEIAILVRRGYEDLAPLFRPALRWLTTDCQPYRHLPTANEQVDPVAELRRAVAAFRPTTLVGAAFNGTWIETVAASAAPTARRLRLGRLSLDGPTRRALHTLGIEPGEDDGFPERVPVDRDAREHAKNEALFAILAERPASLPPPQLAVPPFAAARARETLKAAGLSPGAFLAVVPAGTANVPIKAWRPASFGALIAWAERAHGLPTFLLGARSEAEILEAVAHAAVQLGASRPAVYAGEIAEMPLAAALLAEARAVVANDTGLLHIGAALARPVVGIYGGGTWPRFCPAPRADFVAVVQELPCFGCGWDCTFGSAPCLSTIPWESVRDAVESCLAVGERAPLDARVDATAIPETTKLLLGAADRRLRDAIRDSSDRGRQVAQLSDLVTAREQDADKRHEQVLTLSALIQRSEADQQNQQSQIEQLTAQVHAREREFAARGAQISELTALVQAREHEFEARGAQIADLTAQVQAREHEFEARGRQIEELTALVQAREHEFEARGKQIEELTALAHSHREEATARGGQVEKLTALVQAREHEFEARGRQIEELTTLARSHGEQVTARGEQITELTGMVHAARGELATLIREQDELRIRLHHEAELSADFRERLAGAEAGAAALKAELRARNIELDLALRLLASFTEPPRPVATTGASRPRGWLQRWNPFAKATA